MISANQRVQTISELDPTQKKWKVLYPAYLDSTKKIDQGFFLEFFILRKIFY